MDTKIFAPLFFAFLLSSPNVFAADSKVTISSPANGAVVSKDVNVELNYAAVPGPEGDHLHLYLDEKRIDILHPMKGTADVGMLDPGKHHICLTVNTRGHAPTGAEACIDVMSK